MNCNVIEIVGPYSDLRQLNQTVIYIWIHQLLLKVLLLTYVNMTHTSACGMFLSHGAKPCIEPLHGCLHLPLMGHYTLPLLPVLMFQVPAWLDGPSADVGSQPVPVLPVQCHIWTVPQQALSQCQIDSNPVHSSQCPYLLSWLALLICVWERNHWNSKMNRQFFQEMKLLSPARSKKGWRCFSSITKKCLSSVFPASFLPSPWLIYPP